MLLGVNIAGSAVNDESVERVGGRAAGNPDQPVCRARKRGGSDKKDKCQLSHGLIVLGGPAACKLSTRRPPTLPLRAPTAKGSGQVKN